MSKSFKEMSTEELREYMNQHTDDESGELAFAEYHSRLNWNRVPVDTSPEEEHRIIKDLIARNTRK